MLARASPYAYPARAGRGIGHTSTELVNHFAVEFLGYFLKTSAKNFDASAFASAFAFAS